MKSGDSEFATVTWTGGDIPCLVTLEIEKVSGSYTLGQVVPSDSVGLWPLGPDADDPSEPLPWGSAQATVSYDVSADVIATTIFEMELVVRSDDTGSVMCRSGSGPGIGNGDLCVVPNEEQALFLGYYPSPPKWKHAPGFGGGFVDDDFVTPTAADFDLRYIRERLYSTSDACWTQAGACANDDVCAQFTHPDGTSLGDWQSMLVLTSVWGSGALHDRIGFDRACLLHYGLSCPFHLSITVLPCNAQADQVMEMACRAPDWFEAYSPAGFVSARDRLSADVRDLVPLTAIEVQSTRKSLLSPPKTIATPP